MCFHAQLRLSNPKSLDFRVDRSPDLESHEFFGSIYCLFGGCHHIKRYIKREPTRGLWPAFKHRDAKQQGFINNITTHQLEFNTRFMSQNTCDSCRNPVCDYLALAIASCINSGSVSKSGRGGVVLGVGPSRMISRAVITLVLGSAKCNPISKKTLMSPPRERGTVYRASRLDLLGSFMIANAVLRNEVTKENRSYLE